MTESGDYEDDFSINYKRLIIEWIIGVIVGGTLGAMIIIFLRPFG